MQTSLVLKSFIAIECIFFCGFFIAFIVIRCTLAGFVYHLKKRATVKQIKLKTHTYTLKSIKMYSVRNNNKNCEILFPEKKKISESTIHTSHMSSNTRVFGGKCYSKWSSFSIREDDRWWNFYTEITLFVIFLNEKR